MGKGKPHGVLPIQQCPTVVALGKPFCVPNGRQVAVLKALHLDARYSSCG